MRATRHLLTLWALISLSVGCETDPEVTPSSDLSVGGESSGEVGGASGDDLGVDVSLSGALAGVMTLDVDEGVSGELDASPTPLNAEAGPSQRTLINRPVTLDGSASTGAVTYQWDLGDGSAPTAMNPDPRIIASYQSPGRYRATLTIADATGATRRDQVVVTAVAPPVYEPHHSDTVSRLTLGAFSNSNDRSEAQTSLERFAVVVTDDDAIVVIGAVEARDESDDLEPRFERIARIETAHDPRTLVAWSQDPQRPLESGRIALVCQRSDTLQIFSQLNGDLLSTVALPSASRPYGVTVDASGRRLFVTLQSYGQVAELTHEVDESWSVSRLITVGPDVRGIALLPDGALMMTRWRSPDSHGEVWRWDPALEEPPTLIELAYDPQAASDTEIGGVPNYLDQALVPAVGGEVALPSTQAHFAHGGLTSGAFAASDEVLRAVVSLIDLERGQELFEKRKQFDGRGFASAGVYTEGGDYLYLAMRGSRTVERLDRFSGNQSGTLVDTGRAVEGLALSRDERYLFVNATLDRVMKVYDVSDMSVLPRPIAVIPLVDVEPLAPEILLGKQLFNDSADPRLSREGYIACAHCHLEGDSDHRTWDFSDRGEGLRQTISLLGRRGLGHGPLHWSANFDEGQDFEADLRDSFGGLGLMSDADFHAGTRAESLGDSKAGLSADLDALDAYMTSLSDHIPSPYRESDGALTTSAQRGREVFLSAEVGCVECHAPPLLTDSQFLEDGRPLLHDVGTLSARSGARLGLPLSGLDTPTLHGLWHSAPYLHDGSAATLREVLIDANPTDAHGVTSGLSETQLTDLEAYLLSLDGRWE